MQKAAKSGIEGLIDKGVIEKKDNPIRGDSELTVPYSRELLKIEMPKLVEKQVLRPYKEGNLKFFDTTEILGTLSAKYDTILIAEVAEEYRAASDYMDADQAFRAYIYETIKISALLKSPRRTEDLKNVFLCSSAWSKTLAKIAERKKKENI